MWSASSAAECNPHGSKNMAKVLIQQGLDRLESGPRPRLGVGALARKKALMFSPCPPERFRTCRATGKLQTSETIAAVLPKRVRLYRPTVTAPG